MVDNYIKLFLNVIRNCSVDNTYKMAWAKSLVELSIEESKNPIISLEDIAAKVFKYYWNQTIYFDLIQGSNISKPPEYVSVVKEQIEKYYQNVGNRQPVHFELVEHKIDLNINNLVRILKQDVSWRFLKLQGENIPLYEYTKGANHIILVNKVALSQYADIVFESINFRWTQILENFNSSPRIAKKVRVLDIGKIKRNNLSKFKVFLELENPQRRCFICKQIIHRETPSIDHVIPWSFLFSDDLWNLVYTHRSCNSQKSNIIPSLDEIKFLEKRNKRLLNVLDSSQEYMHRKPTKELHIAIERDYVRKFWISCKN